MKSEGGGGGDEDKKVYGTFQGQQQYPHPQPSIGFPQPVPPPGLSASSAPPYYPSHPQYAGYQSTVPGYAIVEGRPVRERRLPCCGLGIGWLLFLLGFLFAGVPWYAGAAIILFARVDYREKPGYVACTIAAILATIAIVFGLTKGADDW